MILPLGISLRTWANNLIIDFPDDDIPILQSEDEWKQWAQQLIQCDTFGDNNSPGPEDFRDWLTWAQAVYYTNTDN